LIARAARAQRADAKMPADAMPCRRHVDYHDARARSAMRCLSLTRRFTMPRDARC